MKGVPVVHTDPKVSWLIFEHKRSAEGGWKGLGSGAITDSIVCSQDFRKGMNLYLTKFQQKNAATGNCWWLCA